MSTRGFKFFKILCICTCGVFLCLCMCAYLCVGVCRGQKRVSGSQELKMQLIVSYLIGVLRTEAGCSPRTAASTQPLSPVSGFLCIYIS